MNDNVVSRRGLRASLFPRDIPTFSGHFHKPHCVPDTCITYVGSPYQTSLSEAGQAKRLMLLHRQPPDKQGGVAAWTEADSIAIDLGRR